MIKKRYVNPVIVVTEIKSKELVMSASLSSNVGIDYGGDIEEDDVSADTNQNYFGGQLW